MDVSSTMVIADGGEGTSEEVGVSSQKGKRKHTRHRSVSAATVHDKAMLMMSNRSIMALPPPVLAIAMEKLVTLRFNKIMLALRRLSTLGMNNVLKVQLRAASTHKIIYTETDEVR